MALPFYNYLNLIQKDTVYARKMLRLSNKIFGNVTKPQPTRWPMKTVKTLSAEPHYKRDTVVNWYPRHTETALLMKNLRAYGLFRDEHEDFKEEMIRLRALRGKVLPPKRAPKDPIDPGPTPTLEYLLWMNDRKGPKPKPFKYPSKPKPK